MDDAFAELNMFGRAFPTCSFVQAFIATTPHAAPPRPPAAFRLTAPLSEASQLLAVVASKKSD